MDDRIFFPLAIVVAVAMVGGASMVGIGTPICGPMGGARGPADYSEVVIAGADLCRMEAGRGYQLSELDAGSDSNALRIRAQYGETSDDPLKTAHFKLGPDLETVYAGQKLRIVISARPADERGAMAFQVNYSTGKAGESGWQTFEMLPGWETYEYEFDVPQKLLKEAVAYDYLAIRPVVPRKARTVEVRSIVFTRHGPWDD